MKKLLFLLLLPTFAHATVPATDQWEGKGYLSDYVKRIFSPTFFTDYYFSATGADSNSGTSSGSPFQTLTKFATICNNGTVAAGTHVYFKSGDSFSGSIIIQNTRGGSAKDGTVANPIVLTSYNSGAQPVFLYPGSTVGPGADSRTTMLFIGTDHWQMDNLHFTDTDHTNDKTTGAHCGFPIYLGSGGEAPCNAWLFNNVTIDYCGMGIVIYGDSCEVRNCNLTNFKDLKNGGNVNDYGANPFTLLDANNNYIHNNYVNGGWAASDFFGFNGGFAEMFGACSRNRFMYNSIIDCNGISEFGSNSHTALADSNVYAYNLSTNNGALFYANIGGTFSMQVANIFYYNNVAIEQDGVSRYSGSNLAAGLTGAARTASLASPDLRSFGYNTNPSATFLYITKNNVFQNNTAMAIYQSGTTKVQHTYNYYKLSNGSVTHVTLDGTEIAGSATLFENTLSGNANGWSFIPSVGSPLIASGQTISGYGIDFVGRPIVDNMGLYGPVPPAGAITFPVQIGPTVYTGWSVGM